MIWFYLYLAGVAITGGFYAFNYDEGKQGLNVGDDAYSQVVFLFGLALSSVIWPIILPLVAWGFCKGFLKDVRRWLKAKETNK